VSRRDTSPCQYTMTIYPVKSDCNASISFSTQYGKFILFPLSPFRQTGICRLVVGSSFNVVNCEKFLGKLVRYKIQKSIGSHHKIKIGSYSSKKWYRIA